MRFKIIAASYVILRRDDTVLMLKRLNTGYHDGDYLFPAGHVDGGESIRAAAVREAKEEIGITVNENDLELVHVLHRKSETPNNEDERLDFFFECPVWQGDIVNCEPDKCSSLDWFKLDDLPKNIVPYVTRVLSDIENGINYRGLGWE